AGRTGPDQPRAGGGPQRPDGHRARAARTPRGRARCRRGRSPTGPEQIDHRRAAGLDQDQPQVAKEPMTSIDEHKRTALIKQLGTGHTVLVAIATRVPGVQIPSHLTAKPTVFLNLGYNMPKPMEGFLTSETGFEVTLS